MGSAITGLTTTTGNTPNSASATGKGTLGKDDFLKLLMAQLGNQDPTNPTDSSQFVSQLATFAQLELQQNANTDLDSILLAQAAGNQTAAASIVGKDVEYNSKSVALTAGTPVQLGGSLGSAASSVTAVITDSTGKVVRTMQLGAEPAGSFSAKWDGLDDTGKPLPSGNYTVAITAADSTGKSVDVTQYGTGLVTGISFQNGLTQLVVNGQKVNLSDVVEIDQPAATTPAP